VAKQTVGDRIKAIEARIAKRSARDQARIEKLRVRQQIEDLKKKLKNGK
jgi:hypothetical protein